MFKILEPGFSSKLFSARNAIVIALATGLAYALHANGIDKLSLTGIIQPGLPHAHFPYFSASVQNVSEHGYNLTLTSKEIFSVSLFLMKTD